MKILNKVNWIITFISVIIAILVGLSEESSRNFFSQDINSLSLLLVLVFSLISVVISSLIFEIDLIKLRALILEKERELKNEIESHRMTDLKLKNSNRIIYDINVERNTDVITGIPNQLMFQEDVERIVNSIKKGELFQLILLDIDNFGFINEKFGYSKGDSLIRAIAEELYYSMRRNESIYKNRFIGFEDSLSESVYRKYNGGDEFIVVLKGNQEDAVGFVTRLSKQLRRFSNNTVEILGEPFDIHFHGGIAPLFANDNPATALTRVEDCYRLAKRADSKLKIKWFKTIEGYENVTVYQSAITEFTKAVES